MPTRTDNLVIYGLGLGFIGLNAFMLFQYSNFYLLLLPVVLYLLMMMFYKTQELLLLMFLFAPLSLNLEDLQGLGGVGLYLPTEPLLLGLTLVFVIEELRRPHFSKSVLTHPISIALYCHLIWLLITSVSSVDPVVSFKFLVSRIWFLVPIYFYGTRVFTKYKNIDKALWYYLIPLTGVVLYTLVRHASYSFDEETGHWVMSPFYKDHTSYGAILALFIPVGIGLLGEKDMAFWKKWSLYGIIGTLLIGLIFSYTRAAWVSLLAGGGLYVLMRFRVKLGYVLALIGVVVGIGVVQLDQIMMDLERNRTDSSDDLADHMTSATNISTDASNLERINRWNSAVAMWKERPILGWGPGVYANVYAPFQHSKDLTIISTNFGDRGNAHSEYLGALAESGLPGSIIFTLMVVIIFAMAIRAYLEEPDPKARRYIIMLTVGLFTYFTHSALNNYLDTDKAAIPVWGSVAIIVALSLRNADTKEVAQEPQV